MDVAGLTAAKAEAKLRRRAFKTTTKTEASKTVEAGIVIGTEPPAETEVQEGSAGDAARLERAGAGARPDVIGRRSKRPKRR